MLPGDKVKVDGKRYAVVACRLPCSILIRYASGKTEVVSRQRLQFNYGRRGA